MDIYTAYKPFRNYLCGFDLESSLVDGWRYFQCICSDVPLPKTFAVGRPTWPLQELKFQIPPWDLDLLMQELLINAGTGGSKSLRLWKDLSKSINFIRSLEDEIIEKYARPKDVLFDFHRIAHRQFPWQSKPSVNNLLRYLKIFGHESFDSIASQQIGMISKQYFLAGIAASGHFSKSPFMSTNQDYSILGLDQEQTARFFGRLTIDIKTLRAQTLDRRSFDDGFLYRSNILEETPLIQMDPRNPDRVICPIPLYLMRRWSQGMFYDLASAQDFGNSFGESFQRYVGEVFAEIFSEPRFSISAESGYLIKGSPKHGVDWIISDNTANLFIECKTKRLSRGARLVKDRSVLERELDILAQSVVQNYKNILEALSGVTKWPVRDVPNFSIILTLEDWFLFSPTVQDDLERLVRAKLNEAALNESILSTIPYTITSIAEMETAAQVIASVGISQIMTKKIDEKYRRWSLLPYLRDEFPIEFRKSHSRIFADEWKKLGLPIVRPQ